jgi:hypothetical protein
MIMVYRYFVASHFFVVVDVLDDDGGTSTRFADLASIWLEPGERAFCRDSHVATFPQRYLCGPVEEMELTRRLGKKIASLGS